MQGGSKGFMERLTPGRSASTRAMETPVKPIFIFGVPRSGTTLLVNLIGMHPQLAPIFETRFLRNLMRHCEYATWYWNTARTRWFLSLFAESWLRSRFTARCEAFKAKILSLHLPDADFSNGRHNELPFDRQVILYTFDELVQETDRWIETISVGPHSESSVLEGARQLVNTLFLTHCARMNKPCWVNKTPGLLNHLHYLPKLFPAAKCLHIVRDGRDVSVSTVSMPWGAKTVVESARRWKNLLLIGRQQVDDKRLDYMELRYEELINAPAKVLRELFVFLELETDIEEILSRVKIYEESVGKWRREWGREERKAFAREAGDLLIELGYEKDHAWVTE